MIAHKKFICLFILILILFSSKFYSQNTNSNNFTSYLQFFNQFFQIGQTQYNVADIDSMLLVRDVAKIKLGKGKLYMFPPVGNRQVSALFIGKGIFSFEPPTKIEREQLLRFYEEGASSMEFSQAFFLFNDSTLSELTKNLHYSVVNESLEMRTNVKYFTDYLGEKSKEYISTNIYQCLIDTAKNGFFYAQMFEDKYKPFFFEINPYEEEEVRFSHRMGISHLINLPEIICQFPIQNRIKTNPQQTYVSKDIIKNESYKIDVNIESDLDFSAVTQLRFTILKKDLQWIYFLIFDDMEIDSILTSDKKKLEFHKSEEQGEVWICLDKPYEKFDSVALTFYYHSSKIMERDLDAWVYFKAPHLWYPRYGTGEAALFDITYHHPIRYQLVSVGDSISSVINDDIVTSKWITPKPIRSASFNIGYYEQETFKEKNTPKVTVLNAKAGHFSSDMMKEIAFDVMNSIGFFTRVFGECPVNHLYISETPYFHGLAFPGLIHLSWVTFEKADRKGFDETFRAHEVAHQWWGIEVGFKSYHDQWLSEAMSEYAGRWYMQSVFGDNEKFFDAMSASKKNIFENRKYLFSDGQQAGPIYLGYRTSSSETQGDYDLIVYQKGAWIIHMLRLMMIDLHTMKEDRFLNMMNDFYKSFRGQKATTEDFRRIVEKHTQMKMDWFFDQWIYGTELPKYKFAYTVENSADGKYIMRCKVKLENVSNDFIMPVIIKIVFPEDQYSTTSKWIDQNVKEFQFSLPIEPEEVIFNHLDSVLGEVEYVDFDDI